MFMIDAHTHLGAHPAHPVPPETMMAELRASGIRGAQFSPWAGTMAHNAEDLRRGNREALELYAHYADFLYPGVALHPDCPEESLRALDAFRERGLVWVGELLSYHCQIPFDDERWMNLFKICCDRHLIVQMHNAPEVAEVAAALPELTIVGSHLSPEVLPALVDFPNVRIDISGLQGGLCRGTLPKARAMFGAERLLFGTDAPGYDPAPFVMRVERDFPAEEQPLIFGGNLLRLLKAHGVTAAFGKKLDAPEVSGGEDSGGSSRLGAAARKCEEADQWPV